MKKGLIMEGGAMRGMFTAGVIDVLMEQGVVFDGAIGVSAGAAFGCNYKSKQIGRVLRYNTKYCADKRYGGLRSLLRTGNVYNEEFCYNEVPLKLDVFDFDTYEQNPMKFYVVTTDIETGWPVYHEYTGREKPAFEWIRASAAMPLVSQIVEIDGQKMLDGGVSDSIPVRYFESLGYDRNVAILTQPKGYRKEKNKTMALVRRKYRAYPNLVKAIGQRHLMYNAQLDYVSEEEAAGRLFVIRPEGPLPVGRIERDPEKLRLAHTLGRAAAERSLAELKRFLQETE